MRSLKRTIQQMEIDKLKLHYKHLMRAGQYERANKVLEDIKKLQNKEVKK
jgi:protein-arginine kinase activator protein McsA